MINKEACEAQRGHARRTMISGLTILVKLVLKIVCQIVNLTVNHCEVSNIKWNREDESTNRPKKASDCQGIHYGHKPHPD